MLFSTVACKYRVTTDKSSGQQKVIFIYIYIYIYIYILYIYIYIHFLCVISHQWEIVNNNHSDIPVLKPVAVKQYNTHMGGVDRVDQHSAKLQSSS